MQYYEMEFSSQLVEDVDQLEVPPVPEPIEEEDEDEYEDDDDDDKEEEDKNFVPDEEPTPSPVTEEPE